MVLSITKRQKVIILIATPLLLVPGAIALGNYLTTLNFSSSENSYLNSSPSTIAKGKIDSSLKFNSPVTNALVNAKDQKKPNDAQKIKDTEAPIIVNTPNEKKKEEKETASPDLTAPIIKPKFAPSTARDGANLSEGSSLDRLTKLALERKASGLAAEIKKLDQRIAYLDMQVKEINRVYDKEYNNDHYNPSRIPPKEWEEFRKMKLYSCDPSIDCPAIRLDQNKAELERLKKEAQNPKPLTQEEIKMLKQGLLPVVDNPYAWGYDDEAKNPTLNVLKRNNLNRVFNIPGYYSRVSNAISSLDYPGWDKKDVSSQFQSIFSQYGINNNSVTIYEYSPNKDNPDLSNRQPLKAIVLNADDNNAFEKFQQIMQAAIKQDSKIQAVVLKNVGSLNSLQNIDPILKAIPPSVVKLSLFLNNTAATRGLRGLENIKLKELELYSDSNARSQYWAINPNALKNVDYISFDYASQADVIRTGNEKVPSSITFNTIRFDKGDDLKKINEGFEIVFNSKINQRVFQGNFGGKGGWPSFLDFSDTNIKTIKGIWFDEFNRVYNVNVENWPDDPYAKENYVGNRTLKFKRMIFQPDMVGQNPSYIVKIADFNGAQFAQRLAFEDPPPPPTEIQFMKNGQEVYGIPLYLQGDKFEGDAKMQFETFMRAVNQGGGKRVTKIYVESESIRNQLGNKVGHTLVEVKKLSNTARGGENNPESGSENEEIQV
ncbi:putative immunoglobulin-blocking virulence protein [Mycoplasma sp. 'Moose RK']|uniref:putative immunoglobulin-blocking virulence protein n=1 Tax=Mycoplasma sp. 'Moose RK' TaxID=2780095 RepID=UPI0018C1F9A7|nr:putative immunoglobulin-blocking virulence protein [Mycoplasma sp. 'Moose RK']MBG0730726.1 putative immunoglobulin-blocking virulence protein [Mycoplasma sp. 'Moose RK']